MQSFCDLIFVHEVSKIFKIGKAKETRLYDFILLTLDWEWSSITLESGSVFSFARYEVHLSM